jgi:hypothetical protein
MKLLLVIGLLGASMSAGIIQPEALFSAYRDIYPADPMQRRALNQCFTLDPQFNRLDPHAREACYRHYASSAAQPPSDKAPPHPAPNFVDLWRAAGQGHMPQNDIRAEQQNDRFLRPAKANRL